MRHNQRQGFTLIEMVVVLFILAVLAGLVVSIVAMLRRSAEMAGSAKNQADVANNIQLFFAMQSRYPQGLDSLLLTGGSGVYAAEPSGATPDTQTGGMSATGVDGMAPVFSMLTPTTLTNTSGGPQWARSFSRSGFDWLYDHTAGAVNANRSATTQRLTGSNNIQVAELDAAAGAAMLSRILPAGLPTNSRIIVVGFGERNSAIGKTCQNAPVFPGADGKYYARFLCYFQLYADGQRATLVGVSDCMGRTPDYTGQEFYGSQPDGGRQP